MKNLASHDWEAPPKPFKIHSSLSFLTSEDERSVNFFLRMSWACFEWFFILFECLSDVEFYFLNSSVQFFINVPHNSHSSDHCKIICKILSNICHSIFSVKTSWSYFHGLIIKWSIFILVFFRQLFKPDFMSNLMEFVKLSELISLTHIYALSLCWIDSSNSLTTLVESFWNKKTKWKKWNDCSRNVGCDCHIRFPYRYYSLEFALFKYLSKLKNCSLCT